MKPSKDRWAPISGCCGTWWNSSTCRLHITLNLTCSWWSLFTLSQHARGPFFSVFGWLSRCSSCPAWVHRRLLTFDCSGKSDTSVCGVIMALLSQNQDVWGFLAPGSVFFVLVQFCCSSSFDLFFFFYLTVNATPPQKKPKTKKKHSFFASTIYIISIVSIEIWAKIFSGKLNLLSLNF